MHIHWAALLVGLVLGAIGVFVIIFRGSIARINAEAQTPGKLHDVVRSGSTSGMVLAVGVGIIVIGLISISVGIF